MVTLGKRLLLIYNWRHSPDMATDLEYYMELVHFHHQQKCFGAWELPCHQKRISNFVPKPNMVKQKSQYHQPCVWPPKVSGKLETLLLLPIIHWQISLHIFPPLSNSHINLWHITQQLKNAHAKNMPLFFLILFLTSVINKKF